jgi:hypothetical protein
VVGNKAAHERVGGTKQVQVVLQEPGRRAAIAQRACEAREREEVQVEVYLCLPITAELMLIEALATVDSIMAT